MQLLFVGLGNPGEEYEKTRHNIGRTALQAFAQAHDVEEWDLEKGAKSLLSRVTIGNNTVWMALPDTFMNKSGVAVAYLASKKKIKPDNIVVVHDDVDLPIGKMKISFGRGSGGHKGVESIMKALKTRDFIRVRLGVVPVTLGGKLRKPRGDDKVIKFVIGNFTKDEQNIVRKLIKTTIEALETILTEGKEKTMNTFN